MAWKRKLTGGILGVLGFMLSPLSWWNDAVVNLPLALLFAWLVGLFTNPPQCRTARPLTPPSFSAIGSPTSSDSSSCTKARNRYCRRKQKIFAPRVAQRLSVSLLYTAIIVILLKTGILKPISAYFEQIKADLTR